ncbi:MAG TPA: response regulator transcription factor [Propionibacteriaceae bacterium]|nr:response regulator transcription factor [Propionibacteriaceae bacterium]
MNDYDLVVQGVKMLLAPWSSQIEIVELDVRSRVAQPVDIALLDTFAQDRSVIHRARSYLNQAGVRKIAVYSWTFAPETARALLELGVTGVISKRLPSQQLAAALLDIAAGHTVVAAPGWGERTQDPSSPVPPRTSHADWPGREYGLTQREAEMIALVTQGVTNADIARLSFLSPNTVKTYIRSAYREIGVSSRSQAVAWGLRHQMVPQKTRTFPDTHAPSPNTPEPPQLSRSATTTKIVLPSTREPAQTKPPHPASDPGRGAQPTRREPRPSH